MSMLDAFFKKGFNGPKCKTLLKLTIPRIKLLRNRREIQLKQMRRDIAKLLENGQEATARIRVEHIIREENMMAAQEIIELFCELIAVRLPIIETQRECPLDLKEAISSICFAAPRCSDLIELQQVQMLFATKYGREFVAAAAELMPECGVNRQIIELLSVRAPSVEAKLKLLKEIAEEHEVDWDPAESEAELLKPHEDLLDGPKHIIGGSTMPLPKEKHDDSISSEHMEEHPEDADSDAGFDLLDLPEVPKASVRTTSDIPPAPEINPSSAEDFSSHPLDTDSELSKSEPSKNIEVEVNNPETLNRTRESKRFQFIPFVASPPPPPIFMLPLEQSQPAPVLPRDPTPPFVASPPHPPVSLPSKHSDPTPFVSHDPTPLHATKTEANVDMQDVLAAAQAAAEAAERAAAAARAAASLAQVRIAELITKKSSSNEKDGSVEGSETKEFAGKPTFDQQNSFDNTDHIPRYEPVWGMGSPTLSTDDVCKMRDASPDAKDYAHQPQRSVSIEEDPYFSYPNLFTRQDSGVKPGADLSDEHSRSSHGY